MNIVDFIPYGQSNAVTRKDLCLKTGFSDRKVRDMISQARHDKVILNTQDGKGYFQPTTNEIDLVRKFVTQETNRGQSIFWSLKAAQNMIEGE